MLDLTTFLYSDWRTTFWQLFLWWIFGMAAMPFLCWGYWRVFLFITLKFQSLAITFKSNFKFYFLFKWMDYIFSVVNFLPIHFFQEHSIFNNHIIFSAPNLLNWNGFVAIKYNHSVTLVSLALNYICFRQ